MLENGNQRCRCPERFILFYFRIIINPPLFSCCLQVRGGAVQPRRGVRLPERLSVHPAAVPPSSPSDAAEVQGLRSGRSSLAGKLKFPVEVEVST